MGVTVTGEQTSSGRLICLTFDNGPDEYTQAILDVLDTYAVRATFFLKGKNVENYPEIARLLRGTSHEIGNHTYSNAAISSSTVASTASDIEKTDRLIEEAVGVTPTLLRASDARLPESLFTSFIDTRRFVGRGIIIPDTDETLTQEEISAYALRKSYSTAVLTFHDAGANTAAALEILIPELLKEGYRFVTVSEMIEYTQNTENVFSTLPK